MVEYAFALAGQLVQLTAPVVKCGLFRKSTQGPCVA